MGPTVTSLLTRQNWESSWLQTEGEEQSPLSAHDAKSMSMSSLHVGKCRLDETPFSRNVCGSCNPSVTSATRESQPVSTASHATRFAIKPRHGRRSVEAVTTDGLAVCRLWISGGNPRWPKKIDMILKAIILKTTVPSSVKPNSLCVENQRLIMGPIL